MNAAKGKRTRRLVCLALFVLTVAVFGKTVGNGFIGFDDPDYVAENPAVNQGLSWRALAWAFTQFHAGNWHPLTWISHMLDCQWFGLNPGAHHAVNIGIHAANAILLFLVWNRMTGTLWRSAVVAGLFALHPLHVESVAWIAERKDVLSTFFGLLALWAYASYAQSKGRADAAPPAASKSGFRVRSYWLALVLFALSLMAKPMLVTLPFVLWLLDVWPLKRISRLWPRAESSAGDRTGPGPPASGFRGIILEKVPFLALAAASSTVTFCAQKTGGAVITLAHQPASARVSNALVSYLRYLGKAIWPVDLAIFYPLSPTPVWLTAVAGVVLLAISIWAVAMVPRRPYWFTGWFWFVGMLVPVIGLVQVGKQAFADRYTYLPLVGVFVIVVWGAAELVERWRIPKWSAAVAAAMVLSACAAASLFQLQFWKDSFAIFGRAISVTAANAVAQNDLAVALAGAGRTKEAFVHYAEAARIDPGSAAIQNNFGAALAREGRMDDAIGRYREAIRLKPDYAEAYNNLGAALSSQKNLEEAVTNLLRALQFNPRSADAHNNLGRAFALQGRHAEAVAQYLEALALDPTQPVFHLNLALSRLKLGQRAEALTQLEEAVRLAPGSAEAHYELGRCLAEAGDSPPALAHLREAARLRPDWAEPLNSLAWLLAMDDSPQVRDSAEAIRLAERAAALTAWKQPGILNTLAAAYAEAGRFDSATNAAARAVELARESGRTNLAAQLQFALERYQQHRTLRQP